MVSNVGPDGSGHPGEGAEAPPAPGRPASRPPAVQEPTEPAQPLPPKDDQTDLNPPTATGVASAQQPSDQGQQGAYLTTAQGARLRDTDHSLKAGERGPTLLQDHHLREKITHFDHERIPERVVHARGAAAHGVFEGYGTADKITKAGFLAKGKQTPVFTRFSTVLGSRGSADTVRDTRGFATKFYTDGGTFDLVGNNMPVFFIQDGIKFPDIIHAGKPHPDREIPQAQSAHDTFWDFVSLHTEAQHHTIWNMSDRGIPRSFRMMEGFGIHTFRCINAEGATTLIKFHWKPKLGVHSLTWEEAQLACGMDPDFHRRDLADAIEAGAFPQWELGIQVFEDTPEQTFSGIDLLDPTKIVPEELAPVQPVGLLTLNRNPLNYFAETEQVAFHPGHLPPGIDVTDDPLLQARLFSYLDTQITRLAGPNFSQIPINRPHAPVNDMFRDGWHQDAVHSGVAPYRPNSLDGGCPFTAGVEDGAFIDVELKLPQAATKLRDQPASFDDHFSQARLFWVSMSPAEKDHIISAYAFELGKCYEKAIQERQLRCLARIDAELCGEVASRLGLPAPSPEESPAEVDPSPALSQAGHRWPVDGRKIGVVIDVDQPPEDIAGICRWIADQGMVGLPIAAHGGAVNGQPIERTFATCRSIEVDALLLAGSPPPAPDAPVPAGQAGSGSQQLDPRVTVLIDECFRQSKVIGVVGAGRTAFDQAGHHPGPGVVTGEDAVAVLGEITDQLAAHRVWSRYRPDQPSPA
ncbi:catalase [Microlunatus elymi]|uniref:Catalase n=1 Tax=Microlunatus elymi TaxID=2596828 RepID=A0A516Q233_9ACTN|nr:catalase [Microlunatus elymi]QDP97487.1 catalase [Microlunatus elymi]